GCVVSRRVGRQRGGCTIGRGLGAVLRVVRPVGAFRFHFHCLSGFFIVGGVGLAGRLCFRFRLHVRVGRGFVRRQIVALGLVRIPPVIDAALQLAAGHRLGQVV